MKERAAADLEIRDKQVVCKLRFADSEDIGRGAELRIQREVVVQDRRAVNDRTTIYKDKFQISSMQQEVMIPANMFGGLYSYSGEMIDIELHTVLKIDDAILFDTKVKEDQLLQISPRPEVNDGVQGIISPKDMFDFKRNFSALPFLTKITVAFLSVIAGILIVVNTFVGVHDQMVPESETYFYSHTNSDGERSLPIMSGLVGSGALGFFVWAAIRRKLRKYMKFKVGKLPSSIDPTTVLTGAALVKGKSRIDIENAVFRLVAANTENGQYQRGSGTDVRTVSFSTPFRGVVLYEKHIPQIRAGASIRRYLDGEFTLKELFTVLYPPQMNGSSHGIGIRLELQLLHDDFVDQELVVQLPRYQYSDFLKSEIETERKEGGSGLFEGI